MPISKSWQTYESQVLEEFQAKYSNHTILFNQKLLGRYSKVLRQVDILIRGNIADIEMVGVFDCKHFNKKVNVKVIDSMFGFIDDIGAQFGGVISAKGFSQGAISRAQAATSIDLRTIPFISPETLVDQFISSLDFSDPRNSMYIAVLAKLRLKPTRSESRQKG